MPTDYNSEAVWNQVYGKTRPRMEPWISDYEWRQEDGTWSGVEPPDDGRIRTRRSRDIVGYSRARALNVGDGPPGELHEYVRVRDALLAAFPAMQTTDRFFFCGGGHGYLNEVFKDAGYANGWTIEPSSYIQGRKATETRGDIILINEALRGGMQFLNALRTATGLRTADWVIDEEILLGRSDEEVVQNEGGGYRFVDLFEAILTGADQSRIIHFVRQGVSVDPLVYRRPMAEWVAFDGAHSWFDVEAT
jgi:hypothetical protein